eukprot:GHRR01008663.1.p1 GENE.GHRR01008663.1~~GHRR01008663.1.p1  ORF type:complete len:260 (+),score=83.92 GHRR01008663.1:205-984(+)
MSCAGSWQGHLDAAAYSRFQQTCGISDISQPHRQPLWEIISSKHTEGTRHYHNLNHLMFMFDFIQQACKAGYTLQGTATLDWGIWFHDVVHNPESSTNEADSAALAGQLLQAAGLQQDTINKIKTYILATASHHHVEGDPDGDLMMDADLAILGAPLHKYIDYAVAVRKEYGHLSDEEYTKSRARVLKGLLDREQLFLSDVGKSTCEAAARANMAHEWRLVSAGQLLQANTSDKGDPEGAEENGLSEGAAADSSSAQER